MRERRQAWMTWVFVGALLAVCLTLGILQYRWIGEVSRAEGERLQATLQTSLNRLSQEFNADVTVAASRLLPDRMPSGDGDRAELYSTRFLQWRDTSRHSRLFRRLAVAVPESGKVDLLIIDQSSGDVRPAPWPAEWTGLRDRLNERIRMLREGRPPRGPGQMVEEHATLFEVPRFGPPGQQGPLAEMDWLILDVDLDYVRSAILPDLLRRYLGASGTVEYDVQLVDAFDPQNVLYRSGGAQRLERADASVHMFEPRMDLVLRRAGMFRGFVRRRGPGPEEPPPGDRGRWILSVRHRSGSLETVVERGRWRNVAATTVLLTLMLGAVAALVRYTRRSQALADLQMQFVAGVSHELRTPLSVMRTAGHNLQGRVASDPDRVRRYGALIEDESHKLAAIVEQVLSFANSNAGRVIGAREPSEAGNLILEALQADRKAIEESGCVVETDIADGLPPVLADRVSLRHALQNLIGNAAKYGKDGGAIRIAARQEMNQGKAEVVVSVEDHGPGIPPGELRQIFEPFYRGKKAVQDQVHGTGLGLSLAKRIIEAHEGSITVESEEGKGTKFAVHLPAAAVKDHEFTHTTG